MIYIVRGLFNGLSYYLRTCNHSCDLRIYSFTKRQEPSWCILCIWYISCIRLVCCHDIYPSRLSDCALTRNANPLAAAKGFFTFTHYYKCFSTLSNLPSIVVFLSLRSSILIFVATL